MRVAAQLLPINNRRKLFVESEESVVIDRSTRRVTIPT